MKRDETDDIIEQAIIRKGEQQAIESLNRLESVEQLRQIMHMAERKHRPLWLRRYIWASVSVAAVIAIVLIVGMQPRYATEELYNRWNEKVIYKPDFSRGTDENQEAFESALALAQNGVNDQAIEKLTLIAADSLSAYAQDAQWQLALLYLRIGERSNAKQMLHIIITQRGDYSYLARELLDDIKRKRWF